MKANGYLILLSLKKRSTLRSKLLFGQRRLTMSGFGHRSWRSNKELPQCHHPLASPSVSSKKRNLRRLKPRSGVSGATNRMLFGEVLSPEFKLTKVAFFL